MFGMGRSKTQGKRVPSADSQPPDVIISPDTRRAERVPPGQSRTEKWPVLDASGPPAIDLKSWRLRLGGLVAEPAEWNWDEFQKLPRVRVFADFHCVTRWSRLGNLWEGVSTRELIARAGGVRPEAHFVVAYGYDRGWTTNLPFEHLLAGMRWSPFCTMASRSRSNTAARRAWWYPSFTPGRAPSGSPAWSWSKRTAPASGKPTATTCAATRGPKSASDCSGGSARK